MNSFFMGSFVRAGVALSLATVSSFALVADYRYNECSGTTIENHAGSGLNGELSSTGATLTSEESTLSLTGTGSMSVEHNSKLDLVKSMTISIWVKQSKRGQQALITRGDGEGSNRKFAANAEYFLSVNSAGKIRYKHNGVSGTYSDEAIPLNTWTHVVVTRDYTNKQVKIYINGALDSTYTYSTNPVSSNSEKLLVGKCSGCSGTSEFKGRLDEIKIYNNSLSNSRIVELFEAEKDGVHKNTTCTVTPDPTATNDREEVFTTGDVRFNVLDNDIDNNTEDSCSIETGSVVLSELAGAELSDDGKMLVVNNQGMWSVNNAGVVTFTPDNGYTNSPTPISYHISDSCGNDSNEATITLIRQGTNPTTHFTIGDRVWLDANRNGLRDNGEAGVANIRVILLNSDGTEVARTTTDANGEYSFTNVVAGDYSIRFENLPTDNTFTTQDVGDNENVDSDVNAQGISNTFTVATGNSINISAGILSKSDHTNNITATNDREEVSSTGDVRFNVLDNDIDNNTEDSCSIETGSVVLSELAGAELSDDGKMLVVNNQGMWSVNNAGVVTFTPDNGYTNSPTPISYHISDSCGNDSNEATITLIRQGTNPTTHFTIGDRVWLDANRNGLRDNGEAGVANIRVILLNSDGTEVARTTTDANGEYSFTNVVAGDYSIRFENLPTDNTFTTQDVGDNENVDSDVNAQGISNTFTVATGNSINISAGILSSSGGNDGQDGADGHDGKDGANGHDGKDGVDGHDGKDGVDGHDGKDGKDGVDGHDGKDGVDGHDGKDGKDAVCSCHTDTKSDDCGCECETYETSVSSLSSIGISTMLLISTLLGMLLFRRETILKK